MINTYKFFLAVRIKQIVRKNKIFKSMQNKIKMSNIW